MRNFQKYHYSERVKARSLLLAWALCLAWTWLSADNAAIAADESEPEELPILQQWRGDYPVTELHRLPEGQRTRSIGYLDNERQFSHVWQAFKPGEQMPEIDFTDHIVLFSRNVTYYNRMGIIKVIVSDGVAQVLTLETRSTLPIEDVVGMALAVIPRAGVTSIEVGNERIPITGNQHSLGSDPLNATYTLDGQSISLQNGRSEIPINPDSATKIRTFIAGKPAAGDLDGDGDADAAVFLAQDGGGSGTFYYAAVALNRDGQYRGTNAVLLGDRVALKDITIHNGIVIARYADRRPHEPMSSDPSVEKRLSLTVVEGTLRTLKPLGNGEQVVAGWVRIGHEVRTIRPCSLQVDQWLFGESAVMEEILERYRKTLPTASSYAPLFMVLAGNMVEAPRDGFGADYKSAFWVTQLAGVRPKGNCRSDFILVESPASGETIASPLTVRGKARGTWFFEGDFPIVLEDLKGNVIARGFVTAKGEWMTEEFVPFEGTLAFKKPAGVDSAILVFKKDNPSGRPKFDDEMRLFVFLK